MTESQDDKIIRRQQIRATGEHMPEDETRPSAERSDLDERSRAEREAAKRGEAQDANEQMNAIFEGNRKAPRDGVAQDRMFSDVATDGAMGLVRPGRSRLGD